MKYQILAIVALVVGLAQPASALEIFGFTLFGDPNPPELAPGELYYIVETGSSDLDEKALEDIVSGSQLLQDEYTPLLNTASLLSRAQEDYRRLLAALYRDGYYSGEVSILINGQEATSLSPGANLPAQSNVEINIAGGPHFSFGTVGITPLPDGIGLPDSLAPGMVAYADQIIDAVNSSVQGWRSRGYPLAALATRDITANHRDREVDVDIRINPGPQLRFAQTSVTGADRVDPAFITYMADLPVGEVFDPEAIEAARDRLLSLGVFRSVAIVEGTEPVDGDRIDVGFAVEEMPRRRLGIGVTFSNVEGAGLEGYWLHRNLFGHAESLRFDFTVSHINPNETITEYDYHLGAAFRRPGTITPDTDLVLSAFADHASFETVTSEHVEAAIGFEHMLDPLEIGASLFVSYSQISDTFGDRYFRMTGANLSATWDNRDNPLSPSVGFYTTLALTPYYEFAFDNTALHAKAEFRGYQRLTEDASVTLAERLTIGSLMGSPALESPADMLFYAGGSATVRGYDYNSIGVDDGGQFIGGTSLLALSGEIRFAVTDSIGLVGFADAATVGAGQNPFEIGDWYSGIGVGLRYQTGFGPLRLDIARGLNRRDGDPDYAIYVGLGQSF